MHIDRDGALECPAPEDLAAFIDGTLSPTARQALVHHLADCDRCRELVVDTVALTDEELPSRGARRTLTWTAAGLVLAASVMVMARIQPDLLRFGARHPYADLVAAVGTNRIVEARLTGGFAYAPMRPATRAARRAENDNFAVLAARSELEQRASTDPTAANRHAAGLAQLVVGEHEAAIESLEAAVRQEPANAAYQSDLAAAYLARGRDRDRREDFQRARTAAARALALDASLDEAYFNQALALEALGEAREAEEAYRRALARDPESPWNAEINMRLQQVRQP
jgi:hypothetical protein